MKAVPAIDPGVFRRALEAALRRMSDGSLVVFSGAVAKARSGSAFAASKLFSGVDDGSSVNVAVRNPSDSGVYVYLARVSVLPGGKVRVDVYSDPSILGGSAVPVLGLGIGYGSPHAELRSGVTIVTGSPRLTLSSATGIDIVPPGAVVVPPGHRLVIKVTNESGAQQDVSLLMTWWEEPG